MASQRAAGRVSYATDTGNVGEGSQRYYAGDRSAGTLYNNESPQADRLESPGPNKKRKFDPSCQSCYLKKIKCDRQRPICTSCVKRNLTVCEYVDRKEADRIDLPRPKKSSTYGAGQPPGIFSTSESSRSLYGSASGSSPVRARLSGVPPLPDVSGPLHPSHLTSMSAESMDGFVDRIASLVAQKLQANGTSSALCTSCSKARGHHRQDSTVGYDLHRATSSLLFASSDPAPDERDSWAWDALRSLPGDEAIDFAVKFFCNECEPFINCLNTRIFQKQIADLLWLRRNALMYTSTVQPSGAKIPKSSPMTGGPQLDSDSTSPSGTVRTPSAASGTLAPTPPAWASVQGSIPGALADSTAAGKRKEMEERGDPHWVPMQDPIAKTKVDLSVLSLLCSVLAAVIIFLEPDEAAEHALSSSPSEEAAMEGALRYRHLSEQALFLSRWFDAPSISALQSIIILRLALILGFRITAIQCTNSAAIRAAASLGLHRLGSAVEDAIEWQETMDGQDARTREIRMLEEAEQTTNLPPWGKPDWHVRDVANFSAGDHSMRELGRKVWFALVGQEWQAAPRFDQFYSAGVHLFSTKLPSNLSDEELCGLPDHCPLPPIDPDRPTDRAFIETNLLIADACRRLVDRTVESGPVYSAVMRTDQEVRSILESLPWYYSFDLRGEQAERLQKVMEERPITSVQRVLAHEGVWHMLLRLHRQFMARGYTDPAYARSTETCIEASLFIIAVIEELYRAKSRARKLWTNSIHLFHASIVLQIDLNRSAAGPVTAEIAQKQKAVQNAIDMLKPSGLSKPKPGFPIAPISHFIEFQSREAEIRREWEAHQLRQGQSGGSSQSPSTVQAASAPPLASLIPPQHPWMKGSSPGAVTSVNASQGYDSAVKFPGDEFDEILRTLLSMPTSLPVDQQQIPQHPQDSSAVPSNDTNYFLRELFMTQSSGMGQM